MLEIIIGLTSTVVLAVVAATWKIASILGKLTAKVDSLCLELQRGREEMKEHRGELRDLRAEVSCVQSAASRR